MKKLRQKKSMNIVFDVRELHLILLYYQILRPNEN